jgi:hypothetical protein
MPVVGQVMVVEEELEAVVVDVMVGAAGMFW